MSFALQVFIVRRPYCYHLTSRVNLLSIREFRRLDCAATLIAGAGRPDLLASRRTKHVAVEVNGAKVLLRDQSPLHAGNIAFSEGWQLGDLLRSLNERVFFWPGNAEGPSDYGRRHFARYAPESPVLLRASTANILAENQTNTPLFCRFNSGSPRYSGGLASLRGPDTFASSDRFPGGLADVVELTFLRRANLPAGTEVGSSPRGPWGALESFQF
jgi:hypothetical protein